MHACLTVDVYAIEALLDYKFVERIPGSRGPKPDLKVLLWLVAWEG